MSPETRPREVLPFVAGRWQGGGELLEIRDPADPASVVAIVRQSTTGEVHAAYAAALDAALGWASTPALERARVLHLAADVLSRDAQGIAEDLVREEGKTFRDAYGEVERSAVTLRYHAGLLLTPIGSVYPPEKALLSTSRRHPVGVVGVITPFNYPILLPAWKIGPALAFGNVVVWKCSELVPTTARHFMAAFVEAGLPAGVLNLVIGGPDIGSALVETPLDAMTFTGSTMTGLRLRAQLADRSTRVQLELGGKNPAVVLDDSDPEFVADLLVQGAMSATGQKCTAIGVAFVQTGVYDEVRSRLVKGVGRLVAGPGLDPATNLPPLVSAVAASRVRGIVAAAVARGATLAAGGMEPPRDTGHFFGATVLDGLDRADPLLSEEVFGPVLALVPFTDDREAAELANRSRFGLNAAVFARDVGRGLAVCDAVRAGMVHLNAVSGFPPHIPFGGVKDSGFGPLEQGDTARDFFTETRLLHVHAQPEAR